MKIHIILLLLFGILNNLFAQNNTGECECYYDTIQQKYVYTLVESFPSYPHGIDKFYSEFYNKIDYNKLIMTPEEAISQDKILVSFIIDNDGSLIYFSIKGKDEKDYHLVDLEVMRVLKLMDGKWIPGKCQGEMVTTRIDLLFRFRIEIASQIKSDNIHGSRLQYASIDDSCYYFSKCILNSKDAMVC